MLERVNRAAALRVCSAYRTAPTTAILLLAGIAPIKLSINERLHIYRNGKESKTIAKEIKLKERLAQWNNYTGWTKTFIKDVKKWTSRSWGDLDYYSCQAMTGHGNFGSYLKKMGKKQDNNCHYCIEEDNVKHTVFKCDQWKHVREETEQATNTTITKDNIAELIVNPETGNMVMKMLCRIMKTKKTEES